MGHAPAAPAAAAANIPAGVHVPDTVEDLIWLLDQPPNLHEFEEPPVNDSLRLFFLASLANLPRSWSR